MSVRIMTQVWELDLPDSQKIVLLALADAANDEGGCWPSIATIARKSSKSERTVQSVIRTLCEAGHMERIEQPGHRSRFVIHPRKDCTPAKAAPPQGSHPTPAAVAGHPRNGCTQTQKNHNITSSPLTPRGGGRKIRLAISEDWQVPAPGTLPAAAQACAAQWP
ncbi:MAG TPA: helix-turn-helix domain-containing protein, partial [Novosphingobium sp.]|nr:helix-turn-helix domain-containing protein [Novosphingobium sp.]